MYVPGNVLLALGSALAWGGGDFSGGMGVRLVGGSLPGAVHIVLLSHATSLMALLGVAFLLGMPSPHGAPLSWGLAAGVAGGASIIAFYIALSRGAMGAAAAVSGLLAAAIPAAVSMASEGSPGALRLAGFAVAGAAIWMIAGATNKADGDRATTLLAILAGSGFGVYFAALKMAGPSGAVWAMATARIGSLSLCCLLALGLNLSSVRGRIRVPVAATRWVLLTALLDTAGNLLFIEATRAGRLDVAAVLASLYPASTIILAAWRLHERPTKRQRLGMAVAGAAVVMITL